MREAQQIAEKAYLHLSPKGENLLHLRNPLFLVLHWPVKRTGVGDMAKVLVQVFREVVWVLFLETATPL